jgi:hypothetical protein
MFPNVRLMIAATLASVLVLICGFGMFAAFRVSHEPLVRLPAVSAPLQFVADNAVKLSTVLASGEPLDRRLQMSARPSTANASAARQTDNHEGAKIAPETPAAAPESGIAAAEETSAVGEPKEQADLPAEEPVVGTASPAAIGETRVASSPQREPAARPSEEAAPPAVSATAKDQTLAKSAPQTEPTSAAANAAAPPAAPDPAKTSEAGQETKPAVASGSAGEPALAAVPVLTAIEPLKNPPLPHERPKSARNAEAVSVADTVPEATPKIAEVAAVKETKHTRVAIRTYRARRIASGYGQSSQSFDQNSTYAQPNFQTAPQSAQPQFAQRRLVRVRHSKIASRRTKASNSGTGGPFVNPPGH